MKFPFVVCCSPSPLGISHSSLDYLPLLPSRSSNVASTQIAINACYGSVFIKDVAFNISDSDTIMTVGMIWNSFDKHWRFAVASRITPTLMVESIELTESDGRVISYQNDGSGYFNCREPDKEGSSVITQEADCFVRFLPASGIKEKYDSVGRLNQRILPGNRIFSFAYDQNNNVSEITLPSQRKIKLLADELSDMTHHLVLIDLEDNKTPLADYSFNDNTVSALITTIFHPDQTSHQIAYKYINENVFEISGSDLTYSKLIFENGVIKNLSEGRESEKYYRLWSFQLDNASKQFIFWSEDKSIYEIGFDDKKYLKSLRRPLDAKQKEFKCDDRGRLGVITEIDGARHELDYCAVTGLLTNTKNSYSSQVTENKYELSFGSTLYAAKLAEVKIEGDLKKVGYLVYNTSRQLAYKISPQGRIIKFVYAESDSSPVLLKSIQKVTTQFYNTRQIDSSDKETYPTFESMEAWWNTFTESDLSSLQVIELGHDKYGRRNVETAFAAVNSSGKGDLSAPDTAQTRKIFDQVGRETQVDVAKEYAGEKSNCITTCKKYDGLSRITSLQEGTHKNSKTIRAATFLYKDNVVVITHANRLTEKLTKDQGGLLLYKCRENEKNSRKEEFLRNKDGSVKKRINEDGTEEYRVRDALGRLQYRILPGGNLLEYQYDVRDKLTCIKKYDITIENPDDPKLDIRSLISQINNAPAEYTLFDEDGHLRFEVKVKKVIDAQGQEKLQGSLIEHAYVLDNKIRTIRYGKPLEDKALSDISYDRLKLYTFDNPEFDRKTHFFYDDDDLLMGEQVYAKHQDDELLGYTKEYERDGAGNIFHEIVYLNSSKLALTLEEARPVDKKALETWHWYDNAGRLIAALDPDNYLIAYTYYANGKIRNEVHYEAQQHQIDVRNRTIKLPEISKKDHVIGHEYDDLDREVKITHSGTCLEIKIEYDLNDNEIGRVLKDLRTGETRKMYKDYNAFSELVGEATARIAANMQDRNDRKQWIIHHRHPNTGLTLSTVDALGNITLFYYNQNRDPVITINPDGSVIHYQYDPISKKPNQIYHFYKRLDRSVLEQLQKDILRNGFFQKDSFDDILQYDDKDRVYKAKHDADGLLIEEMTSGHGKHRLFYNIFDEIEKEIKEVDKNKELIIVHQHDLRGNRTETVLDPENLNIKTRASFDDPLNRETFTQSNLGAITCIEHEGLRSKKITEIHQEREKTIVSDAFMRDKTVTDWTNTDITQHIYDDEKGEHTIISPENDSSRVITETNNAFGELEKHVQGSKATKYARSVDGQIEKTIHPDGCQDSNTYDLNGKNDSHTDVNGKVTKYVRNKVGVTEAIIDNESNSQSRATLFDALNVYGEAEHIQSPSGLKLTVDIQDSGLTVETTRDEEGLGLVAKETKNYSGEVTQIVQGDLKSKNQYQEDIELDVLNRETERALDKGTEKKQLIKSQAWNPANQLLFIKDGNGGIKRNVYDIRGNLCFIIDAEGFVIEKTYDVNDREISQRCYITVLSPEELGGLSEKSTAQDIQSLVKKSEEDALRYRIHDLDGFLRYEINLLEKTKEGLECQICEWKHVGSVEYTKQIEYAKVLNLSKLNVDITKSSACAAIESFLKENSYISDSDNRVKDVCRDLRDRAVFKRDGEGYVVEKRYSSSGKIVARVRYADKAPQIDFTASPGVVFSELNVTNPLNRITYNVYDIFDNLRFTIDGEGFVIEYRYDNDNHHTDTFCYFQNLGSRVEVAELTKLYVELGKSTDRNIETLISLMNKAVATVKDDEHDVHIKEESDVAGRLRFRTDGENKKEEFRPNALDLDESYIDKRQKEWQKKFNRAKDLELEISPPVDIALVTQDEKTQVLTQLPLKQSVETQYGYDNAFNQSSVTFAANVTGDVRKIFKEHNKKREFIGTKIQNVNVDNGTDALPEKNKRPEITKESIDTQRILDYSGKEKIFINERGVCQFTIFDSANRERFRIDGDGFITEFHYKHAFKEYTQITQYFKPFPKEVLLSRKKDGFKLNEVVDFIQAFSEKEKEKSHSIYFVHDRRGLIKTSHKDIIITAESDSEGNAQAKEIAPYKTCKYNAFREVIVETELVSESVQAVTHNFYNNNGNATISVSPRGFVVQRIFGMAHIDPDKKGNIELKRIERALPISPAQCTNLSSILEAIQKNSADRFFDYVYDRRLLQCTVTMSSGEKFCTTQFDTDGKLILVPGNYSVTFETEYDDAGDPIAYVKDFGDKRYLTRDARGDVIYETEYPIAVDVSQKNTEGQPKKHYPLFKHYVNAHKQTVGTKTFFNPCEIKFEDGEVILSEPKLVPQQDEEELLLMDNRGNRIVTQTPEGHLKFATFDECKNPVRGYHWVKGYQFTDKVESVDHLHATRQKYNDREQIIMQSRIDGEQEVQTHRQINAFGNCTGEGPSENDMRLKRAFDKAGNCWYTNEEKGIPTITFPNAKGEQVALFRAPEKSLSIYKDDQQKAKEELLQSDYSKTFAQHQRTILLRDLEGNVEKQFAPWYGKKPKEAPAYKQMSFTILTNLPGKPKGTFIAWRGPDEKLLIAEFKMLVNGKWIKLGEIFPTSAPITPDQDIRCVDVSDYPANCYQYQLDFYYQDPETHIIDKYPSYRAEGEVMLDTGNYKECTTPIWYMKDDCTLIIAGKIDNITGVELVKEGKPYKRFAGNRKEDGKLVINLEHEISGNYEIRYVYGFDNEPVEIKPGEKTGNYTLSSYFPAYLFAQGAPVKVIPGTLPSEIVHLDFNMHPVTMPLPSRDYQLGGKKDGHRFHVSQGETMASATLYGKDINQQSFYLGQFFNGCVWRVNDKKYGGYKAVYPGTVHGDPFLLLRNNGAVEPHALVITDDKHNELIYQLLPWAGGTYRVPGFNIKTIKVAVASILQAKTSSILGCIQLQTKYCENTLTAKEISIKNLSIGRFLVGGVEHHHSGSQFFKGCSDDYFYYQWISSLPLDHYLMVSHSANHVVGAVYNISQFPRGGSNLAYYQQKLPLDSHQDPGYLYLSVVLDGELIPLGESAARVNPINAGRQDIQPINNEFTIAVEPKSISYYSDFYGIYLSPLPKNTTEVLLEVQVNTSIGKKDWQKLAYKFSASKKGLIIFPGSLQPGYYDYHMIAKDSTGAILNLEALGLQKDEGDWSRGTLLFRKGLAGNVFVSKSEEQVRTIVKPVSSCEHDHWKNRTKVISRANYAKGKEHNNLEAYAEITAFNLFDQPVRTLSPVVECTDEHDKPESTRLVKDEYYNSDRQKIGEAHRKENEDELSHGVQLRLTNHHGTTLLSKDEDDVCQIITTDMLHRVTSNEGMTSGKISSEYQRRGESKIEIRKHPNGTTEEIETNQAGQKISYQDQLKRNSFSDFNMQGQETLHINPKKDLRKQSFHPRSGVRLSLTEANNTANNTQTWQTQSQNGVADTVDEYFGNIVSHTDLAGQIIDYKLNCNKQTIAEKGFVNDAINQNRGRIDLLFNPEKADHINRPGPRDIVNILNEAGLIDEIIDNGVQLTTRLSHDEDDYTDSYYFVHNDGRVYQGTHTEYDALHRIVKLFDIRCMIHLGYDYSSNRRFAKAYLFDDDPSHKLLPVESWNTYTKANRPLLRDGVLTDGTVSLAPQQGLQLSYDNGRVDTQMTKNSNNEFRLKKLSYQQEDILNGIVTTDLSGGNTLATMIRKVDKAQRCLEITQVRNCEVLITLAQPMSSEYFKYEIPTFVFSLNGESGALYYYLGHDRSELKLDSHEVLKKIKHFADERKRADQIDPSGIQYIKEKLTKYYKEEFGEKVIDKTDYNLDDDSIRLQTRSEKNDKKTNKRKIMKSNFGRPELEVNTYHDELSDGTNFTITDTFHTNYYKTDSANVSTVTVDRKIDGKVKRDVIPPKAEVFTTQNANGMITTVQGELPETEGEIPETYRHFVINSENLIVFKESGKGRNYYFYAEKRPGKTVLMAYFGDLPEEIKYKLRSHGKVSRDQHRPPVINIDTNHQPLSAQYPPPLPSDYCVPRDMSYFDLAEELNYTGYAEAIAHANNADANDIIKANSIVKIPPLYFEVSETAWNGSLPSLERIIGSLYPAMPNPHIRPKAKHVDWVLQFVEVAACVAIMAFAPEAIAGILELGAGVFATGVSYGAAAALANTATQGISMTFGNQKHFDFKALAVQTITSAISAGMMDKANFLKFNPKVLSNCKAGFVFTNVIQAEEIALTQQAALMMVGLQRRFDWNALSIAAFNALAESAKSIALKEDKLSDADKLLAQKSQKTQFLSLGYSTAVNNLSNAAIRHQKISAEGLSAAMLGQMVGSYAGNVVNQHIEEILETQRSRVQAEQASKINQHRPVHAGQSMRANRSVFSEKKVSKNSAKEVKQTRAQRWRGEPRKGVTWEDKHLVKTKETFENFDQKLNKFMNDLAGKVFNESLQKVYDAIPLLEDFPKNMEENLLASAVERVAETDIAKFVKQRNNAMEYYSYKSNQLLTKIIKTNSQNDLVKVAAVQKWGLRYIQKGIENNLMKGVHLGSHIFSQGVSPAIETYQGLKEIWHTRSDEDVARKTVSVGGKVLGGIAGAELSALAVTCAATGPVGWVAGALIIGATAMTAHYSSEFFSEAGEMLYDSQFQRRP